MCMHIWDFYSIPFYFYIFFMKLSLFFLFNLSYTPCLQCSLTVQTGARISKSKFFHQKNALHFKYYIIKRFSFSMPGWSQGGGRLPPFPPVATPLTFSLKSLKEFNIIFKWAIDFETDTEMRWGAFMAQDETAFQHKAPVHSGRHWVLNLGPR